MIKPRQSVPAFSAAAVAGGGPWKLSDPRNERFLLLVVYRGYHCPICKRYIPRLEALLDQFTELGVKVVALSTDDEHRAAKTKAEWQLDKLTLAYGLSIEDARKLGLFVSRGMKESEPELFAEPGLFIIEADNTLYASSIQSMPFTRPDLEELLGAVKYIMANRYPARGEA
jgi:peroxiredoxin